MQCTDIGLWTTTLYAHPTGSSSETRFVFHVFQHISTLKFLSSNSRDARFEDLVTAYVVFFPALIPQLTKTPALAIRRTSRRCASRRQPRDDVLLYSRYVIRTRVPSHLLSLLGSLLRFLPRFIFSESFLILGRARLVGDVRYLR